MFYNFLATNIADVQKCMLLLIMKVKPKITLVLTLNSGTI